MHIHALIHLHIPFQIMWSGFCHANSPQLKEKNNLKVIKRKFFKNTKTQHWDLKILLQYTKAEGRIWFSVLAEWETVWSHWAHH